MSWKRHSPFIAYAGATVALTTLPIRAQAPDPGLRWAFQNLDFREGAPGEAGCRAEIQGGDGGRCLHLFRDTGLLQGIGDVRQSISLRVRLRKDIAAANEGWPGGRIEREFLAAAKGVVFFTGGGAIGFVETCMAFVEHYKLAEAVGEPTPGADGNISPFTLPGGDSVSWTGMKALKQDGSARHGVGVRPAVPVKPAVECLAEGRDEVLEKGIEVVSR